MNVAGLFNSIRAIDSDHKLEQVQVDTVNALLASCAKHAVTDLHQIAYVMATAYHECRLKPVEENGKGAGRPYGKKLKQAKDAKGNHIPYTTPDKIYYGRGDVQLTWYENYATFSKILGLDLLNHPELALQVATAAEIAVIGMKNGLFTSKSLKNYFTGVTNDPINARRIINGTDAASLIAGYYNHFYDGLTTT